MIGTSQPLPTPICRCWSLAEVGDQHHQRCARHKPGDLPYLVPRNRLAGDATWLNVADVRAGLGASTSCWLGRALPGGRPSCRRAGDAGPVAGCG
jgi:hypothetical protein